MAYLDVGPMTVALRATPEAFTFQDGYLRHAPSSHDFLFDGRRHVQIRAQCLCAHLSIRPDQEGALIDAFERWQIDYWRPYQINREFASHFKSRSRLRQLLVDFTGWLHRLALRPERTPERTPATVLVPAE